MSSSQHEAMMQNGKRNRGGERRAEILDVALRLFAQHGMANVTTRQIAKAVGISQPSLYAHFRTADEIGTELCIRSLDTLYARFATVLARRGSAGNRLMRLGRAYIEFGLEQPDMYRIAFMLEAPQQVSADKREDDPGMSAGLRAFGALHAVIAEIRGTDDMITVMQTQSIWACIHGLTSLLIARPNFPWIERERLIEHHLERICAMADSRK